MLSLALLNWQQLPNHKATNRVSTPQASSTAPSRTPSDPMCAPCQLHFPGYLQKVTSAKRYKHGERLHFLGQRSLVVYWLVVLSISSSAMISVEFLGVCTYVPQISNNCWVGVNINVCTVTPVRTCELKIDADNWCSAILLWHFLNNSTSSLLRPHRP